MSFFVRIEISELGCDQSVASGKFKAEFVNGFKTADSARFERLALCQCSLVLNHAGW